MSGFQQEILRLYREFFKVIYSKPAASRGSFVLRTRLSFKEGAKISRRDISKIDFAYNRALRELTLLKEGNVHLVTQYSPKGKA